MNPQALPTEDTVPSKAPTLRARLLRHVLLPLALTWLVGTLAMVLVSNGFTERAFDRSLLGDAYAMAANVRLDNERLDLVLTPREIRSVLFDPVETIFFSVLDPDGRLLAGNARLEAAPPAEGNSYRFSDIDHQGRALRAVRLRLSTPQPFDIVVAETTRVRDALQIRELLVATSVQLLLLAGLAWWLWRAIQKDLRPLSAFQQALAQRSARDLAPLPIEASSLDMLRLGSAVNGLLSRVAHSVQAQREFAGNVAHELRTPLAGIRAQASYGLGQSDPALWKAQLAGVLQSEARATHLVNQLLALALADEALPSENLLLDERVRDAVLRALPRADAAGVDLGAKGLDHPVPLHAPAVLIDSLLNNLIDNALRYGHDASTASPQVTVELREEPQPDGVVRILSVIDNGPGIPAEARARWQQRGIQGPAGKRLGQGAGLGLSIAARCAEALGATLRLEAGPGGQGLCAQLVFPSVSASADGGLVHPSSLSPLRNPRAHPAD